MKAEDILKNSVYYALLGAFMRYARASVTVRYFIKLWCAIGERSGLIFRNSTTGSLLRAVSHEAHRSYKGAVSAYRHSVLSRVLKKRI